MNAPEVMVRSEYETRAVCSSEDEDENLSDVSWSVPNEECRSDVTTDPSACAIV